MNYRNLTIIVSDDEMVALAQSARRDLRKPRDQARYLLRSALGLAEAPPTENTKTPAVVSQATAGAFAVQSQPIQ